MALLDLYFDVTAKRLVKGLSNPEAFTIGTLYNEEQLPIQLRAMRRVGYLEAPIYEQINLSGYGLTISIGSAGTSLAEQTSWTLATDQFSLSGALDLNTAGISALSDNTQKIFEVRLFDGTNYYRSQNAVLFKKSVKVTGAVVAVGVEMPLTVNMAAATYLPRNDVRSFTMLSQDGTKRVLCYIDNDGSFRSEPIT